MNFAARLRVAACALLTAGTAGVGAAVFLAALGWATRTRAAHPGLVWALPVVGAVTVYVYHAYGKGAARALAIILGIVRRDEAHELPLRAPLLVVLFTCLTHLAGGSAGREGTAVQMGAGVAHAWVRVLRIPPGASRALHSLGVAAGFAAVFGTPWAAAVFAYEWLGPRERRAAWAPWSLGAALLADLVARSLGATHSAFRPFDAPPWSVGTLLRLVALAAASAVASAAFLAAVAVVKRLGAAVGASRPVWLVPVLGGAAVALLAQCPGWDRYLGLGVPTLEAATQGDALPLYAPLAKTLMTALTVGTGFVGGEVTPLFFVGATTGASLSHLCSWSDGAWSARLAALGMVAVFAASARVPLAMTVMAAELFGPKVLPAALLVSCTSAWVIHRVRPGLSLYGRSPA